MLVGLLALLFAGAGVTAAVAIGAAWSEHSAPHAVALTSPPVRFDLPRGWGPRDRTGKPSDDWVKEAAATQGFTPEEYVAKTRASMLASEVGPPVGGRYQTVDVQKGGFTSLPTTAEVEARLLSLGFRVDDVRTVTTPAGQVVVARARVTLRDGEVSTRVVHLVSDGIGVQITVSAMGPGDVAAVTDEILATLHTS